jgi:hypothetical protein
MTNSPFPKKPAAQRLRDRLVSVARRERSGAETAGRYDFQVNWALCELLARHKEGNNYCVILEYHDDVVILDDSSDPDNVEFFQIKTKRSGHWSVSELLRLGGASGAENSMLGKLYRHRINFPQDSVTLRLVSNMPFKVPLQDGSSGDAHDEILARDLERSTVNQINRALRKEMKLSAEAIVDFEDIAGLKWCQITVEGAATHAKGKLAEFLYELFPERKFRVPAVYVTLFDELKRKNNCVHDADTFSALVDLHGITRKEFEVILRRVGVHDDPDENWRSLETLMARDSWPVSLLLRVKSAWRRYEAERIDASNIVLQRLAESARSAVDSLRNRDELTLKALVEAAQRQIHPKLRGHYSYDYVTAVLLYELVRPKDEPQLPPLNQKPASSIDATNSAANLSDGTVTDISRNNS